MDGLEITHAAVLRRNIPVLQDVTLTIEKGDVVLLLGPNGSGKSTFALALAGHPDCHLDGEATFFSQPIRNLQAFERARAGIFLAHQEPPAISGVTVADVLRAACEAKEGQEFSYPAFSARLRTVLEELGLTHEFAKKEMHAAFSGGEKKKIELLSLLLLAPKLAILDEIDAGMDRDMQTRLVNILVKLRLIGTSFLIISHQENVFSSLSNVRRIVLKDGRIPA